MSCRPPLHPPTSAFSDKWVRVKVRVRGICVTIDADVVAAWLKYFVKSFTTLKTSSIIFGRPYVKRFALCYQTVVCPVCLSVLSCPNLSVCLSVTSVYCSQTVGWINMKLGTQEGYIVLDGDTAPLPERDRAPNFWPMSIVAKWLDG